MAYNNVSFSVGVVLQQIVLNFFGELVVVESEWTEILDVLNKDFWSFVANDNIINNNISPIEIKIFKTSAKPTMPEMIASMQTKNAITYDEDNKRYCDYYGKAYSDIDFDNNRANLYGSDFDRVHEIAYLLILSRVGKKLDLRGLHKLHAFAVSFRGIAFVCMMSSKGGKSTLLAELLRNPEVKMISDDIPLVDALGRIRPFPLKLGLDEIPPGLQIKNKSENIYMMKRAFHGDKILVSTKGLEDKIESSDSVFSHVILAEAFRYNSRTSKIISSAWVKTFKGLLKHGVLGLGCPLIIEYFWQAGWLDFFVKVKIFIFRCVSFTALSFRAKKIKIYSGTNPSETARDIISYLNDYLNKQTG